MKPQIENLKLLIAGRELNGYQLQDATVEFWELLKYVDELEKLQQPPVIKSLCEHDFEKITKYGYKCKKCGKTGFSPIIHG